MFNDDPDRPPPPDGRTTLSKPDPWISPEEYLDLERRAETKSEYLDGRIYAMAGASRAHNAIVANLVIEIGRQVKGGPCRVYPSDLRVRVSEAGMYTYPDVSVVCGEAELEDEHRDTLLNPTVLIEVLSESTERYDRGRKAEHYRRIGSLQEYVLVAQAEPHVECYRRAGEREWVLTEAVGLDESAQLTAVPCVLLLRDVYDGVF
ncbi:MAG TPA: Uma2 family endonuclease [Longimicrobiales bacterium]|nr:Uma2 family endonuclease [Longimicrobiales bacterium]